MLHIPWETLRPWPRTVGADRLPLRQTRMQVAMERDARGGRGWRRRRRRRRWCSLDGSREQKRHWVKSGLVHSPSFFINTRSQARTKIFGKWLLNQQPVPLRERERATDEQCKKQTIKFVCYNTDAAQNDPRQNVAPNMQITVKGEWIFYLRELTQEKIGFFDNAILRAKKERESRFSGDDCQCRTLVR